MTSIEVPYHFITFEQQGKVQPSEGQAFAILDNHTGNVIYQYYVSACKKDRRIDCYPIITYNRKERKCFIDMSTAPEEVNLDLLDDNLFLDWGCFI